MYAIAYIYLIFFVAGAGFEPARAVGPEDFHTTLAFKQAIYLRCCSLDYFFIFTIMC